MEEWRIKAAAFLPPADIECRDGQVAIHEYPARPSSAPRARAVMRTFLEGCEVGADKVAEILTAAGEAVANAIEHA
ncbi:MAG: ATP-binding protein, partial [Candidatus Eremiobacteraeota bacterium]|nr:ATP-binding protein [Candidatus Eremiobacteraeota bacterium]